MVCVRNGRVVNPEPNCLISSKPLASEYDIQVDIAEWLTLQYPNVIFHCDLAGVRVSKGLAKKIKRLNPNRGWPDITVAEVKGRYAGLYIELKKNFNVLYRRDGKMRQNKHIIEQQKMLQALEKRGYRACFACGFREAQSIIKEYLTKP